MAIVSAAVRINGLVISMPRPARHHTILQALDEATGVGNVADQGFLTDRGKYMTRVEAMQEAIRCDQQFRDPVRGAELFSENLW
ncbi:MAG: hypothetical protein HOO99_14615 [Hyphomicrobiaceae bacterium]|nr:hypothetical protein [Hyphomicrobiaceae bacterium]